MLIAHLLAGANPRVPVYLLPQAAAPGDSLREYVRPPRTASQRTIPAGNSYFADTRESPPPAHREPVTL
ncbi:hypothetical protein GCM10011610_21450 [Nocardia rhizosphaerihabitans]|uniref:Uncharacterized protein n=1 Tax=Nocardia rhizosphaerihabitans TaxID=1691570 RepID=A0ABQ2KBD6_9NOCA|nr:hypothetical protein GCM10011610_21450 [Nocardia rhizosphaerihabitans]